MVQSTDAGVKVSVETFYQPDYSNPVMKEFMFAYRITIENNNPFPIKMCARKWTVFDSTGDFRVVEGPGLVGVQPVINAGEEYQYVSGCNLHSEIGRMHGTYRVENLRTRQMFEVNTPSFEMYAPNKLN